MGTLRDCFGDVDWVQAIGNGPDGNAHFFNAVKNRFLFRNIVPSDVFIHTGQGAVLQTNIGEVIDLASMTVNCVLGQNDPWVKVSMIAELLSDRPSYHSSRLGSDAYYSLPNRLAALEIGGIQGAKINHKQCNGSDVTELAVKMGHNKRNGRKMIVSFEGSYHGQNMTGYLVSGEQVRHQFLAASDNVVFLPAPDNANVLDAPLSEKDAGILDALERMASDVFAIVIEPIQANNGMNMPGKTFMQRMGEIAARNGICLIYDEIQTGFGWLGSLTAAERLGVVPSILCLGKGLTSGFGPLALAVANEKYAYLDYGSGEKTGGADVRSLVAANAVIDRLLGIPDDRIPSFVHGAFREELGRGLLGDVPSKVQILDRLLQELTDLFPDRIVNIRGDQMMRGMVLVDADGNPDRALAAAVCTTALAQGVLVRQSKNVVIIKPPIVITEEQLQRGFSALADTFKTILTPAAPKREEALVARLK